MKNIITSIKQILDELTNNNGRPIIVGGCVRDYLLGENNIKDIDIEVHNMSYEKIESILSKHGKCDLVGKSFGVIAFKKFGSLPQNGIRDFDFSIPRRETKIGIGHTEFEIDFIKNISMREAFGRRDFTINAIGYDYVNDKFIDYYNGIRDLNNRVLRHTTRHFNEDPLRILRAMQLQCRFGFRIADVTRYYMQDMIQQGMLTSLPIERIAEEFKKWAIKGKYHYMIFDFLRDVGLDKYFIELSSLLNVPQDYKYHPEGCVETHTKLVLQEALQICMRDNLNDDDKEVLIYSALLHDIAKPLCTESKVINGIVKITSHGHEQAGVQIAETVMKRMGVNQNIIEKVKSLIGNHMQPANYRNIDKNNEGHYVTATHEGKNNISRELKSTKNSKIKFLVKLKNKLGTGTIEQLMRLIEADMSGRHPLPKGLDDKCNEMILLGSELKINKGQKFQNIINGKHLIELGLKPGKEFKEILNNCIDAQIEEKFTDVESGKEWVLKNEILNPMYELLK